AEQLGREERRLLSAGAGANLEDGVARIGLVLRQQQQLDLVLERRDALLQQLHLRLGERAHIGLAVARKRIELRLLDPRLRQRVDRFGERRQIAVFLGKLGEIAAGARRIGESVAQLGMAAHDFLELHIKRGGGTHAFLSSSLPSRKRRRSKRSLVVTSASSPASWRSTSDGSCRSRLTRRRVTVSASPPSASASSRRRSTRRRSATTAGTARREAARAAKSVSSDSRIAQAAADAASRSARPASAVRSRSARS